MHGRGWSADCLRVKGFWLNIGQAKQTKEAQTGTHVADLGTFFSAETLAIARKEYQSAWRIPQRRIGTLQGIFLPFIIVGFSVFNAAGSSDFGNTIVSFFPIYILLTFWIIGQNMLGWEHKGLAMLLLTPVRRRHIFRGKILVLTALAGFPYVLFGAFFVIRSGDLTDGCVDVFGLADGRECDGGAGGDVGVVPGAGAAGVYAWQKRAVEWRLFAGDRLGNRRAVADRPGQSAFIGGEYRHARLAAVRLDRRASSATGNSVCGTTALGWCCDCGAIVAEA